MTQAFSLDLARKMAVGEDITQLQFDQLLQHISNDPLLKQFAPDGICQIDPRNGNLVVYNSSRAKRPQTHTQATHTIEAAKPCPICEGASADILDIAEQSEGFTFISKNLYPIFHPIEYVPQELPDYFQHQDPYHLGRASYGFHLLQWTSSIHDRDWYNIPLNDATICLQRLAAVESTLLHQPTDFMAQSGKQVEDRQVSGYVSIIKNYGASAGASLVHGHQQIAYSNILPQHFFNNLCFRKRHERAFSQYMIEENPAELLVKDYGAVQLMVPYFMKRPLDMLLIFKESHKRYLHQLTTYELTQLAQGIQQAIRAIVGLMTQMGMTPAYNMIINNGPGCGLYVEFLTKTQMMGGYEQIGLYVCQANPYHNANSIRQWIAAEDNVENRAEEGADAGAEDGAEDCVETDTQARN
ncbi:hypothetical protein JYB87_07260 [Shewanella avicenniae]|uniref:Galactose-1-phosphate uridylyltransferase n=1 Tax=Shewanella avicenniae TaxID=2814294 RepID=A0ABX7QVZ4_9GAMM|nr:hypothetical protein [Shewanella avicenniae]QSX35008.1 hypothetical protein JYB87_07260 [Shewanella avicenniae]